MCNYEIILAKNNPELIAENAEEVIKQKKSMSFEINQICSKLLKNVFQAS